MYAKMTALRIVQCCEISNANIPLAIEVNKDRRSLAKEDKFKFFTACRDTVFIVKRLVFKECGTGWSRNSFQGTKDMMCKTSYLLAISYVEAEIETVTTSL